jgi:hypothetical protein
MGSEKSCLLCLPTGRARIVVSKNESSIIVFLLNLWILLSLKFLDCKLSLKDF